MLGAFLEACDFVFAGIKQPDRVAYVGHSNADVRGALAVHFYLQLRRIEVEARIDVHQFRVFRHPARGVLTDFRQPRQFRPANYRGDRKINLAAEHGRQAHVVGHVVIAGQNLANLRGHLNVTTFSLASRRQHNEEMRVVRGAVRE